MSTESNPPSGGSPRAARVLRDAFDRTLDRAARESAPLTFDEIAAFVDGELSEVDREIFESRLADDPALRAEVEDLRALREVMPDARTPELPIGASGRTASAHIRPFPSPTSSQAQSLSQSLSQSPSQSPALSESSAAAPSDGRAAGRPPLWTFLALAATLTAAAGVSWLVVGGGRPPASGPVASAPASPAPTGPATGSPTSPAPASIVALRDSGREVSVDAAGNVGGLAENPPVPTRMVAEALTAGTLPHSKALAGLAQRELTLMGGNAGRQWLAVLSPMATVVRDTRPTFRWTSHSGARGYTVTIYDQDFEKVVSSPVLQTTTWRATTVLTPGQTYQWQVAADTPEGSVHAPAPPAPDARFRVMDAAARKSLEQDLAHAQSSRLLAGLIFAKAGLLDEAEQAFAALLAENPDSPQVTRLLASVRERRAAADTP